MAKEKEVDQQEVMEKTTKPKAGRPRSVVIPDELWAKAEDLKWKHRMSINEIVRRALENYLNDNK